eukprot:365252-Chlamydomonas_euryale.AAC.1
MHAYGLERLRDACVLGHALNAAVWVHFRDGFQLHLEAYFDDIQRPYHHTANTSSQGTRDRVHRYAKSLLGRAALPDAPRTVGTIGIIAGCRRHMHCVRGSAARAAGANAGERRRLVHASDFEPPGGGAALTVATSTQQPTKVAARRPRSARLFTPHSALQGETRPRTGLVSR